MLEALGDGRRPGARRTASRPGTAARSGSRSSWAHAVAHNIEFEAGDVLVTETSAPIWGYNAELERAMIIGPPTDEMRRLFDHTVAAQQAAFDALRPGVDLRRRRRRRHALPRGERPRAATGASTPATRSACATTRRRSSTSATTRRSSRGWCSRSSRASTTTTIGGFRHSDTVVVTDDGIEILTDYPSDIESLTIPA